MTDVYAFPLVLLFGVTFYPYQSILPFIPTSFLFLSTSIFCIFFSFFFPSCLSVSLSFFLDFLFLTQVSQSCSFVFFSSLACSPILSGFYFLSEQVKYASSPLPTRNHHSACSEGVRVCECVGGVFTNVQYDISPLLHVLCSVQLGCGYKAYIYHWSALGVHEGFLRAPRFGIYSCYDSLVVVLNDLAFLFN